MEVLTIDEVATKLKYNRETVLRLIRRGQIKARKLGGQWRVKQDDLDTFINGGEDGKEG